MRLSFEKLAKWLKELHSPARGQHAPALHQAVLAHGHARSQRRPRRQHRRDIVPPPPYASNRMEPPRHETRPAAGQHKRGDDVDDSLLYGPWPAGHAAPDRAHGQDRRRLARAALAGAHSSRHFGERPGNDDHDPFSSRPLSITRTRARKDNHGSFSGTWRIHASEATLAAMRAAFPHNVLCFIPPRSTSYLQPCNVAVFRFLKSCIQTQASATLARSVLDDTFDGLAMNKAPVFGRVGSPSSHGPPRQKQGVGDWLASLARPQRRRVPRCCHGSRGTPLPRESLLQAHRAGTMAEASDSEDDAPPDPVEVHRTAPGVRRWTTLSL